MLEGRDDTFGDDRTMILRYAVENVVADRPRQVGGVEIDELMRPAGRDQSERPLGKVAVRIEKRHASSHGEVLGNQMKERGALAGSGLSDDVKMPAAVVLGNTKIRVVDRLADVADVFEIEDHGPERAPKSSDPFAADGRVAHPWVRTVQRYLSLPFSDRCAHRSSI